MRLDKSLAAWKAEFVKRHGEANVQEVSFQQFAGDPRALGSLFAELLTPSLFSAKRLVILRGFPSEPVKKLTEDMEKTEQACLETLEQVPEDVVILLVSRRPDKRRSIYKKVAAFAKLKEFLLKDIDVTAQVTMELAGMVAREDVPFVVQVLEGRRETIANDMTMLRQYGMSAPLTRDVVELLCPPKLEESVFIILEGIFSGHRQEALARLQRLFIIGAVPLQVLGAFTWQMEMLVAARSALEAKMSAEEAADILNTKPYSITKAMRSVQGLSKTHLAGMVHRLADIDRLSKTGGLDMDGDEFVGALSAWIMRVPSATSA